MLSVKMLADSINPIGNRLTTFELVYPRFIHAQLMTHRDFSRNAASSRAIPVQTMIKKVKENPAIPLYWGKNQKGMQSYEELPDWKKALCKEEWLNARDTAITYVEKLIDNGLHKQYANRILEPFMHITVIVSATNWNNFFFLRTDDAQPEIAWLATEIKNQLDLFKPNQLKAGQWHLPLVELKDILDPLYVDPLEIDEENCLVKISAARCARVSYLTHDGRRDLCKDIELHNRLVSNGHWSPLEHPAYALDEPTRVGNFIGWNQYRKTFKEEYKK